MPRYRTFQHLEEYIVSSLVYRVHSINLEKACEEEKVRQEWPHDQDTSSPHHQSSAHRTNHHDEAFHGDDDDGVGWTNCEEEEEGQKWTHERGTSSAQQQSSPHRTNHHDEAFHGDDFVHGDGVGWTDSEEGRVGQRGCTTRPLPLLRPSYRIVSREKPSYRIDIVSSRKKAYRYWLITILAISLYIIAYIHYHYT